MQPLSNGEPKPDSDFEEDIIVTRQEEERDPEAEAEFDRELAKMMAESLDSRKFDRKPLFDVSLPMRKAPRESQTTAEDSGNEGTATPPNTNTMAFSLMTKKGNKQQARAVFVFTISYNVADIKYRLEQSRCPPTRTSQSP